MKFLRASAEGARVLGLRLSVTRAEICDFAECFMRDSDLISSSVRNGPDRLLWANHDHIIRFIKRHYCQDPLVGSCSKST